MRKQAGNQSSDSQARGYLENIASARTKAKGCVIRMTKTNKIKLHTEPGTVVVDNAQPKQCNEYIDVCVVFHTVTVETALVVTRSQKVQSLYRGVYFSALWT